MEEEAKVVDDFRKLSLSKAERDCLQVLQGCVDRRWWQGEANSFSLYHYSVWVWKWYEWVKPWNASHLQCLRKSQCKFFTPNVQIAYITFSWESTRPNRVWIRSGKWTLKHTALNSLNCLLAATLKYVQGQWNIHLWTGKAQTVLTSCKVWHLYSSWKLQC